MSELCNKCGYGLELIVQQMDSTVGGITPPIYSLKCHKCQLILKDITPYAVRDMDNAEKIKK